MAHKCKEWSENQFPTRNAKQSNKYVHKDWSFKTITNGTQRNTLKSQHSELDISRNNAEASRLSYLGTGYQIHIRHPKGKPLIAQSSTAQSPTN